MLRQMSRRAHIDNLLHTGDGLKELADILEPTEISVDGPPISLKPEEMANILAKAPELPVEEYHNLLHYLHERGRPYREYSDYPHPPNSLILPPRAQRILQIHRKECTFSCKTSHEGNSAIQFYNPWTQTRNTGFIQNIWQIPLDNIMQTFIGVRSHRLLSAQEGGQAPYEYFPGFMTQTVDALPSDNIIIIEPMHIITHVTIYPRPAGTYAISKDVLNVCWALNRGRQ